VNTTNNSTHCGACNNTCTGGRTCVDSVCQCPAGQTFCGSVCVNVQTDPMNCGQCGRACQTPTGTTTNTCAGGMCNPACGTLRDSCDMEPWDGCEENLASNNAHCGACGRACQTAASAHVTTNTCNASGVCVAACATGWDSCDSEPWDGCETDITSVTNCGLCGRDCADAACGTTGSTSCCVATSGGLSCQSAITTANDIEGSVAGPRLDNALGTTPPLGPLPQHALQAGTNRLILVVVASETGGDPIASRPDAVTYGGTAMTPGPEQSGGSRFWAPDLYAYYLAESGLAGKSGNQTIVVNGSLGSPNPGSPVAIIAHAMQLNGVRQSNPLTPSAGGVLFDATVDMIQHSVSVATTGSRVYSIVAGLWTNALTSAVTPTGLPVANLLNTAVLAGGGTEMRASAVYVGAGAATSLAPGSYTVAWTATSSDVLTHLAFVINPAQQ
jgi:hypothetical protein